MYAIYAYIGVVLGGQWGGIYGIHGASGDGTIAGFDAATSPSRESMESDAEDVRRRAATPPPPRERERGHLRPPSEGGCAVFVSSEGGIGDVGDGVRFKQPLRERHHILILSMHPRIMAVDVFQDCHHSSFYRHPHHEL